MLAGRRTPTVLALMLNVFVARAAHAHTVYLNFSNGRENVVFAEQDAAAQNRSRLCGAAPYQPWLGAEGCGAIDTCRDEIVVLVAEQWRDFDIDFTVTRPNTDFSMVLIGPATGTCKFGAQGIADTDCNDQLVGNIAFAFDCEGSTSVCAGVISHELGHTFGLDHTTDANDLMNSGIFEGKQIAFQNRLMQVSSSAVCGAATQNSYLQLQNVLGLAADAPRRENDALAARGMNVSRANCQFTIASVRHSRAWLAILCALLLAQRTRRRGTRCDKQSPFRGLNQKITGTKGSKIGTVGHVSEQR